MATTTQDLMNELKAVRDEIKLKVHLAGMDARDAWEELNKEADHLEQRVERAERKVVSTLVEKLRKFADTLEG